MIDLTDAMNDKLHTSRVKKKKEEKKYTTTTKKKLNFLRVSAHSLATGIITTDFVILGNGGGGEGVI